MNSHVIRGVAMVLVAAMLWGTTGTAQSFAPRSWSPYWVGALRLAVAAVFFWLMLLSTGGRAAVTQRLCRPPWPSVCLAAVCMCAYNLAFFAGVRASGVAVGTAVALGSGPVWAGLLQAVLSRTRPARAWWLGTTVAVAGVVVLARGGAVGAETSLAGVPLCLLAGLSYAAYALVNQGMVNASSPAAVTTLVFTVATLLAIPGATALAGAPSLRTSDAALVLWLGVVATGLPYLLFSHALRHVSADTAVVLALAEPVMAFLLAIAVVGEHPGWMGAMGLVAVLAGLLVVVTSEMSSSRRR